MVTLHGEVIKFIYSHGHGIGLAKGGLEGLLKGIPISGESRKVVILEFEGRFVPLLGGTLEPRSSIVILMVSSQKSSGQLLKTIILGFNYLYRWQTIVQRREQE